MTTQPQPGMDPATDLDRLGLFDARYGAFLDSLAALRPRLHATAPA